MLLGSSTAHRGSIALQLCDVMYQAVHQPLAIHLALAPKRKSIELACMADVTEYGLDRAKSATVLVPTAYAVDLAFHLIQELLWSTRREPSEEHHLPIRRALRVS